MCRLNWQNVSVTFVPFASKRRGGRHLQRFQITATCSSKPCRATAACAMQKCRRCRSKRSSSPLPENQEHVHDADDCSCPSRADREEVHPCRCTRRGRSSLHGPSVSESESGESVRESDAARTTSRSRFRVE